ncbi:MAG: NADH-quinone oxidoreductase subunit M [Actinomycetota bacterium]|nr:NADH-quinone oxidoreductase subunit M [Actinomycetota bacterium]
MSWLPSVLVATPAVGAVALLVWPRAASERHAPITGVVVTGVALLLSLAAVPATVGASGMALEADLPWIPGLDVRWHLGVDGISLPLVLLTTLLTLLCMVSLLRGRAPGGGSVRALVSVVLLLESGVLGTFLALDLVLFFVFFELVLVPMWFVIADWGDPHDLPGRRRAASTFLLLTVVGSAVMLAGFLLVYAHTGTFDMVALASRAGAGIPAGSQLVAALAIGLGLAVKSPMWPLHIWLPDAHAKAPTVGSVLLAGVLLKMGTYGFVRIWLPVAPDGARAVAPYLAVLAAVGIVYGALACLAQTDLKRLVAYSSVGHMGFVLLGIATLTPVGVNGALVANIAHGLITGLLFFLVGALKDRHDTSDLVGLGRGLYARSPRLGATLALAAMASLGLPGLAGFWGEMLTLLGAFDPAAGLSRPTYLVCMVLGGLGAVLTATYFVKVLRAVCQGDPAVRAVPLATGWSGRPVEATRQELAVWVPLVALTVLIGLAPGLLLDVVAPAVDALLGGEA